MPVNWWTINQFSVWFIEKPLLSTAMHNELTIGGLVWVAIVLAYARVLNKNGSDKFLTTRMFVNTG